MGVPPLPRDPGGPYEQPTQWAGHTPMPPPPPQPQVVYVPVPADGSGRRRRKQVTRRKVGGAAHSMHLVLTVCTCGLWGIVWFAHWLFTRSKTVTRG